MSAQPRFIQLVETLDAHRARRPAIILAIPPALPPIPPAPFTLAADYEPADDFDPMAAYIQFLEQRVANEARRAGRLFAARRPREAAYMAAAVRRGRDEFAEAERAMLNAPIEVKERAVRQMRHREDWDALQSEQRYGGWGI